MPKKPCSVDEFKLVKNVMLDWNVRHTDPTKALPYDALAQVVGEEAALTAGDGLPWGLSEAERELMEAALDYALAYPDKVSFLSRYVSEVLEERRCKAKLHPEYATQCYRFLSLPWRRQILVLERLGLLRDTDPLLTGENLFARSFTRALERGAFRHLKILVTNERDQVGLERTTAAPPDPIPDVDPLKIPEPPPEVRALVARMEAPYWWEGVSAEAIQEWWAGSVLALERHSREALPACTATMAMRGDRTALRRDDLKPVPGVAFDIWIKDPWSNTGNDVLKVRAFYESKLATFVWFVVRSPDAGMGVLRYSDRMSHWQSFAGYVRRPLPTRS